ncbi:hypothetical protein ACFVTF_00710 [Kitasatospora sp. NPDC057940]|uniref:hypothetical protein n=1 Tax=Kitasatospora sp. NPDC057940 TaxID=3346285 RepID=UPI0036D76388
MAITAAMFETPVEAERGFDGLRVGAAELTARITHVRDGIGWIWVVPGSRSLPEVRSSRAYERYATCQNAFRRFVVLLAKQPARDLPVRDLPARELPGRDRPGRDQSVRDQAVRDQSVRERLVREQSGRERPARDLPGRELPRNTVSLRRPDGR